MSVEMSAIAPAGVPVFKHALFNQYNLILLGGAVLYALALWSPLPLEIALVGEAIWLGVGSRTGFFRAWIAAQAVHQEEARWTARIEAATAGLDADGAARVRAVGAVFLDVVRLAVERGVDPTLGPNGLRRLESLLDAYAQLQATHHRFSQMSPTGRAAAVEEEMVHLAKSVVDERDPNMRVSLRQALAMGQRRLKQMEQIDSARRALEAKLATLENALAHVRAQVAGGGGVNQIAADLAEMQAAAHFTGEVGLVGDATARVPGAARTTGSVLIRPA